jgi:tRNA(fMet)-specific endonuclease VapC
MDLWVLDTDSLTLLYRGHESVCRRARAHAKNELAVTIVTVEEVLTGWYAQIRRATDDDQLCGAYRALQDALEFISQVRVLPFDLKAAQRYRELGALKPRTGTNDLRIAAIVLENDGILVTRNSRDFGDISGLRLEDWS